MCRQGPFGSLMKDSKMVGNSLMERLKPRLWRVGNGYFEASWPRINESRLHFHNVAADQEWPFSEVAEKIERPLESDWSLSILMKHGPQRVHSTCLHQQTAARYDLFTATSVCHYYSIH